MPANEIMTQGEAASYLRISATTLRKASAPRGSIPCVYISARCIRYSRSALDRWIEEQSSNGHEKRSAAPGGQVIAGESR